MTERAQPMQARDKLAFLLSLVPYLMDHDRVSVHDAAKHFGVTPEQIRESVRLIAVSGIPGDTAAYQHDDLFDIAWDDFEENDQIVLTNMVAIDESPRFSGREAAALIAGLQYLSALPENADRAAISSLMSKLARGSSTSPSPVAIESAQTDSTLALVREAVASGRQFEFDYRAAQGELERRRVDPLRVESADAEWYLRAWCHTREAVRTFRIDRMSEPAIVDAEITHRGNDVVLPDTLFQGSPEDLIVTLDVARPALALISDYLPFDTTTGPDGDAVRTRIRVSHVHGLKRLVASLPGLITVVSPAEAREAVARWAAAGVERYQE